MRGGMSQEVVSGIESLTVHYGIVKAHQDVVHYHRASDQSIDWHTVRAVLLHFMVCSEQSALPSHDHHFCLPWQVYIALRVH